MIEDKYFFFLNVLAIGGVWSGSDRNDQPFCLLAILFINEAKNYDRNAQPDESNEPSFREWKIVTMLREDET